MERLLSLFGMAVILGIAWALSTDRKAIRARTIYWGLGLQFALALFVLKTPIGQNVFSWVGGKITRVLNLSYVGSDFVFGALGVPGGGMLPVKAGELTARPRSASSSRSRSCPRSSSWRRCSRSSTTWA